VPGVYAEDTNTNLGIAKSIVGKGEGKRIGLAAPNKGTSFLKPEDGAWDPRNSKGCTPTATLETLLDGTEGGDMFDNIAVDRSGAV
jgi:hypothetical protein